MKALFLVLLMLLAIPCMAQSNLTFQWDLSTDDALLGAGGGYHLYASKNSGQYTSTAYATVAPGINTVTVVAPGLGRWYFVATAFIADGSESANSNEVVSTIKPKPPKLNTVQQVAVTVKNAVIRVAGIFRPKQNLRLIREN